MINTKSSFYLLALLLVSSAFFPSSQQAFAVSGTIDDQLSCEALGLTWVTVPFDGCQIDGTLTVGSGEILNSNVLLYVGTTGLFQKGVEVKDGRQDLLR